MQALSFSFENNAVRTLGTPETPLFVALDVCGALGHTNPRKAIKDHVDPEDLIKVEIETNGGRQTVNAVNESGLYALIFGSKLPSAKRFKRWITSEVLPAIRRTGRYETAQPALITTSEQYEIRKAIKARAKNSSVHYQTVYNALYDYFKIASYKDLRHDQMKAALTLIETCSLKPHDELSFFELAQEHNALQTTAAAEYSFSVAYNALEAARAMLALTLYDSPFSTDSQTCRLLDQVMFCNAALKNRVTALANRALFGYSCPAS